MNEQLKVNPIEERYRECPECDTIFYADHLSTKWCSNKCHDTYHNRLKRIAKSSKEFKVESEETIIPTPIPLSVALPQNESVLIADEREKNIEILSTLDLHAKGTEYEIAYLVQLGYDTDVYDVRYPIPIDATKYFTQIANFMLFYTQPTSLLIITNKNYQNEYHRHC